MKTKSMWCPICLSAKTFEYAGTVLGAKTDNEDAERQSRKPATRPGGTNLYVCPTCKVVIAEA